MQIVLFLLDNLFFFLVGAALLRAWMNMASIRMTQQPGQFVMAVTDWLVRPLRKALPAAWKQSWVDWGSLIAAALLALAYSVAWHALFPGRMPGVSELDWVFTVPAVAGLFLLRTAVQGVLGMALIFAILSWVQPFSFLHGLLGRLIEPWLQPIRRVLPRVGGVDLSVLALMVLLQVVLMLLG